MDSDRVHERKERFIGDPGGAAPFFCAVLAVCPFRMETSFDGNALSFFLASQGKQVESFVALENSGVNVLFDFRVVEIPLLDLQA